MLIVSESCKDIEKTLKTTVWCIITWIVSLKNHYLLLTSTMNFVMNIVKLMYICHRFIKK